MAHFRDGRVVETTATSGTGPFTVTGAIPGHKAFAAALRDDGTAVQAGDTFWGGVYEVDSNGNASGAWAEGLLTLTTLTSITITTTLRSSNSNAAVTFGSGTKWVVCLAFAPRILQLDNQLAVPIPAASAEPSTPGSGQLLAYVREIIPGHMALKTLRPSGVDSPVQDGLAWNTLKKWQGNGTAMVAMGAAIMTVSTAGTAVTPASGSAKSMLERIQYATNTTAGNLNTGISPNDGNAYLFRGAVNGEGGGKFVIRCALNALNTGTRWFAGIAATRTAATNVDPLTVAAPARIGLAINANTGNMQLVRSDGTTAAAIDLGANFPVDTTSLYELALFVRPHNGTSAGDWGYRVRRYTTNSNAPAFETTGTLTTNVPAATTLLHPWWFITNNAQAAAVSWHFGSMTIEKDW